MSKPQIATHSSSTKTPFNNMKQSIVIRAALILFSISITALIGTAGSMIITKTLAEDTAAINLSGSIRMLSYQILTSRLLDAEAELLNEQINQMEAKLHSDLLHNTIHNNGDTTLTSDMKTLKTNWQQHIKPILKNRSSPIENLTSLIERYITQTDTLIHKLQQNSESKIAQLNIIQNTSIIMILLILGATMILTRSSLILPLREIVSVAHRIKQGHFDTKIQYDAPNELGLLSYSVNQMSTEITALYQKLEQRVASKTQQLQRSNQSLQILYDNTKLLYSNPAEIYSMLPAIMNSLQETLKLGKITLCLRKHDDSPAFKLITSDQSERPSFCQRPNCGQCRNTVDKTLFAPHLKSVAQFAVISGDHHYGDISVEIEPSQIMEEWKHHLLSAMADIIATKLNLSLNNEKESRIVLMEERAAIARELHDSLAQSLSYQKLQASRLRKLLQTSADTDQLYDAISEVQDGLNRAYKDLRELISAFRINVNEPGMEAAINLVIDEFRQRSDLNLELEYNIRHCPLTPNEETHCLHIVREALSNVVKHAHARHAQVRLNQSDIGQSQVVIEIEDSGIGIPEFPNKQGHYGLSILSERTQHLRGELEIKAINTGGTLVHVHFHPSFLQTTTAVKAI